MSLQHRDPRRRRRAGRSTAVAASALALAVALAVALAGCAPGPRPAPPSAAPSAPPALQPGPQETPPPDGDWRPHLLARCRSPEAPTPAAMAALGEAWSLFSHGEGADAITVLELHLRDHPRSGLVLLALGQLYLMAGQGRPDLMPREGPAADVGDWGRNQRRLLGRAAELLRRAVAMRPDDAVPEYLLADVARAGGDLEVARRSEAAGHAKCSLPQSFELLRRYQELNRHPARLQSDILPQYPRAAVERGATGEVVADLLIDPAGRVAQVVLVEVPDPDLGRAAAAAMREASFVPARIGKYPIWSWLRIPVRFSLTAGAGETDG